MTDSASASRAVIRAPQDQHAGEANLREVMVRNRRQLTDIETQVPPGLSPASQVARAGAPGCCLGNTRCHSRGRLCAGSTSTRARSELRHGLESLALPML